MTDDFDPALVPELLVTDVDRSIEFWCKVCGFEKCYSRPEERFAYIALGTAHVMLEQVGVGRNWVAAALEAPFGRGINFQITVPDTHVIATALARAGIELFMQPETKWYRAGDEEAGVQQFVVTDPDGYLIRFQSSLGRRPTVREPNAKRRSSRTKATIATWRTPCVTGERVFGGYFRGNNLRGGHCQKPCA